MPAPALQAGVHTTNPPSMWAVTQTETEEGTATTISNRKLYGCLRDTRLRAAKLALRKALPKTVTPATAV